MKKLTTRKIAACGLVAAAYAVITLLTASFAYGPIQFRLSETLCVLCWFEPTLTIGFFVGCLVANLFSPVSPLDIVIGSAATLIACLIVTRCKKPWVVPLPVILANALLVGAMLAYVYTPDAFVSGFILMGAQVGLGELVVMYALGYPLLLVLKKGRVMERLGLSRWS